MYEIEDELPLLNATHNKSIYVYHIDTSIIASLLESRYQ